MLTVTAEILKQEGREVQLKTQGFLGEDVAVSARLVLERFNLADAEPDRALTDVLVKKHLRELWALLYQPVAATTALDGGLPKSG